jgi:hypothetical protein
MEHTRASVGNQWKANWRAAPTVHSNQRGAKPTPPTSCSAVLGPRDLQAFGADLSQLVTPEW